MTLHHKSQKHPKYKKQSRQHGELNCTKLKPKEKQIRLCARLKFLSEKYFNMSEQSSLVGLNGS